MKNPSKELAHLRKIVLDNQEKLIGEILHNVKIYEVNEIDFAKMKEAVENYTKETFRITKAIESQEVIEKVLIKGLK